MAYTVGKMESFCVIWDSSWKSLILTVKQLLGEFCVSNCGDIGHEREWSCCNYEDKDDGGLDHIYRGSVGEQLSEI